MMSLTKGRNIMKTVIFSTNPSATRTVYGEKQIEKLREGSDFLGVISTRDDLFKIQEEVEVIFSTWGMMSLSQDELKSFKNLKALFYAAGSVKNFAKDFLDSKIKVFSAWKVNAIPVAEYTLAQITLSAQGYHRNINEYKDSPGRDGYHNAYRGEGLYDINVAIIGGGAIGQMVMDRLEAHYKVNVQYVASRPSKRELSLEDAFKNCYIVSNHLPNREDNIKVITKDMFLSMPKGGTFINTGRGAQIDEDGMAEAFAERPDLTAVLDVTDPEPIYPDSPLMKLANVHITTHISGSMGRETLRMSDTMIDDFYKWEKGQDVDNEVTLDIFEGMA
jgi:phosphoglycerate dehydrogenase-like enzyme